MQAQSPGCVDPTTPSITASPDPVCNGSSTTLTISGTLNDAVNWSVYSGSCGGTLIGTTTGTTLTTGALTANTTFYIRGEGGCLSAPGNCGSVSVTVNGLLTASISGNSSPVCAGSNATFTITGTSGAIVTYNLNGGAPATITLNGGTATITVTAPTANQTLNLQSVSDGTCTTTLSGTSTDVFIPGVAPILAGVTTIDYLVVAGGGGGGGDAAGGGGGGGVLAASNYNITGTTSFNVTVGGGGVAGHGQVSLSGSGGNSSFGSIIAIGGGSGGKFSSGAGGSGGSGGGGAYSNGNGGAGTAGQGFAGGKGNGVNPNAGGGGGGAGGAGFNGNANGVGGIGIASTISGSTVYYGGGGGGGRFGATTVNNVQSGGGGHGGSSCGANDATPGTTNTGGGGGGSPAGCQIFGAAGGSGIVIIRYAGPPEATGGTITQAGGYTIHTFTNTGTSTFNAGGATSICAGATTTFLDQTPGGVWSSSNPSIATVDAAGVVTGVSPGTANITYTVTNSGCTSSASMPVTINGPVITCPATQSASTTINSCANTVSYTPVITGTPTPTVNYVFSGATTGTGSGDGSGSSFNNGTTTVTLTATNSCSSASCSFDVVMSDVTPPDLTSPGDQSIDVLTGTCANNYTIADPVSDNCSGTTWSYTLSGATSGSATGIADGSGSGPLSFNEGLTTVTLNAVDGSMNAAVAKTFTVTVNDNINPTITAPAATTGTVNVGCTSTNVILGTPVTADNCTVASVTNDAPSAFPLGTTTVTWTVTDGASNTANATQLVTVSDNINPTIIAPAAATGTTNMGCASTNVVLGSPVTTDNCSVASVTNDAPPAFPIGTTTVNWTVTDGSNNTATATQLVTVSDNINPTIISPVATTGTTNAGCTSTNVVLGSPVTADNCSVTSVTNDAPASFPVGTTTVTWTVTDGSNNTATATQLVTVTDDINPGITAPAAASGTTNSGCTSTNVILGTPVTSDNCSVASVTNNAPASFPLGTTTVTWTVTDGSNNTATATQLVTVTDNINPTITAPSAKTGTTNTGCTSTNVVLGTPVTADNCTVATITNNAPSAFSLGITLVTWTVTDGSNNTATATQTVTITDNVPPTVTCPGNVSLNVVASTCANNYTILDPVSDNCTSATWGYTLSGATTATVTGIADGTGSGPLSFSSGVTTVTLNGTDGTNNASTCSFSVTVIDNEPPVINCASNITVNNTANVCGATVTYAVTATDNCTPLIGQTFSYTGSSTSYIVPPGVNSLRVKAWGGGGGGGGIDGNIGGTGGGGAYTTSNIPVTPGETLTIVVGGGGNAGSGCNTNSGGGAGAFGYGTGGTGGNAGTVGCSGGGGGGGGSTAILRGSTVLLAAAGGGGGGGAGLASGNNGGAGGPSNTNGINSPNAIGGLAAGNSVKNGANGISRGAGDGGAGGGGGGGYLNGGGGGGQPGCDCSGAGGGGGNNFTGTGITVINGSGPTPGNASDVALCTNCAKGGNSLTAGGQGLLSIAGLTLTQTAGLPSGASFPVGTTTNTFTATDLSNNTASCSFTVTVVDAQAPTLVCANQSVNVTANSCTGSYLIPDPITDNCTSGSTWSAAFTGNLNGNPANLTNIADGTNGGTLTFQKGVTTVTLTGKDGANNIATSCSYTVTVIDNQKPVLTAPGNQTLNVAGSTCAANYTIADPIADNCTGNITWGYSLSGATSGSAINIPDGSGSGAISFNKGVTSVTLSGVDASGNSATAVSFTVTVNDNVVPVITCPGNIITAVASGACNAAVTYATPSISDNCSLSGFIVLNQTSNTSVAYSTAGNTIIGQTFKNVPAYIALQSISIEGAAGSTTGNTTSLDLYDATGVTLISSSSNTQPVGLGSATYNFSGVTLAPATTYKMVIRATQIPTSYNIASNNVSTYTDGQMYTGANAATAVPTADLNFKVLGAVVPKLISGIASGGVFPVGTTTQTWSVNDFSGNTASCSFNVTVQAPEINVQSNNVNIPDGATPASIGNNTDFGSVTVGTPATRTFVIQNSGTSALTVSSISMQGTDASQFIVGTLTPASPIAANSSASVTVTFNPGSVGMKNATVLLVNDDCDEANYDFDVKGDATCLATTFTNCPGNQTLNTLSNSCSNSLTYSAIATGSPSPVVTYVFSGATSGSGTGTGSGSSFNKGLTNVTITADNNCSPATTCTFTVTVTDNINPTITAPAATTGTTNAGCTSTNVVLGIPVTADNCTVASVTNDAPASFPIGNTTVTWTVTDGANNIATATQLVTVTDNINPSITAPAATTGTTNVGCTSTNVVLGTPVTSDNCSVSSVFNDAPSVFPYGTTLVTWTVKDGSNNTATATQTVTVTDNQNPVFTALPLQTVTIPDYCQPVAANLAIPGTSDNCGVASVVATVSGNPINPANYAFAPGSTTVVWTVTDIHGRTATANQVVTVSPANFAANLAVAPLYPMSGQEIQTIYLNYPASAQSETITSTPSGGTAPFTYNWTKSNCNVSTLSSYTNTSNVATFSPTLSAICSGNNDNVFIYTVNVADAHGCTATAIKKLNVVNPYVGNNIQVCHKVSVRGASTTQLITVSPSDIALHIAHGDGLGNCPVFTGAKIVEPELSKDQNVVVYPNPTTGVFIIELSHIDEQADIVITDVQGKLITHAVIGKNEVPTATFNIANYAAGMYLIQVRDSNLNYRAKIILK